MTTRKDWCAYIFMKGALNRQKAKQIYEKTAVNRQTVKQVDEFIAQIRTRLNANASHRR